MPVASRRVFEDQAILSRRPARPIACLEDESGWLSAQDSGIQIPQVL
jgi:hypothetical protein